MIYRLPTYRLKKSFGQTEMAAVVDHDPDAAVKEAEDPDTIEITVDSQEEEAPVETVETLEGVLAFCCCRYCRDC